MRGLMRAGRMPGMALRGWMRRPMWRLMRALLCAVCMCACFAGARVAMGDEFVLTRDGWPQHANGPNVLALPAVRRTLRHFDERGAGILIRHPGGDAGMQWARELHDWLIAFGVPARHLELQPGSGAGDRLVVEVGE